MQQRRMELQDVVDRELPPKPWAEGEKIPWDDPDFSARMLKEHLSQEHDMASRRQSMVDCHVSWIHDTCLQGRPARVLDLACGPGLYSQALAQLGHICVGIDFSPSSIAYAQSRASQAKLGIRYVKDDLRSVSYGEGFDLAILLFGEFNVFRKSDAELMLSKAYDALGAEGCILLEPQTFDAIKRDGERPACWRTESSGLFSSTPHCWLDEHFWHADCNAATARYFILDAATSEVDRYASTTQAYTDSEYDELLTDAGFAEIQRFPSLAVTEDHRRDGLFVLKAQKA
jgi:SAM-dependent methyltransferase